MYGINVNYEILGTTLELLLNSDTDTSNNANDNSVSSTQEQIDYTQQIDSILIELKSIKQDNLTNYSILNNYFLVVCILLSVYFLFILLRDIFYD